MLFTRMPFFVRWLSDFGTPACAPWHHCEGSTPFLSVWCSSVGVRLAVLCLWRMSGFSTPLYCHPAANPISSVLVLQALPLSFSRKGIPIEIPEATFSVLHQLFLFQPPKRSWGWLVLQLKLDRPYVFSVKMIYSFRIPSSVL